MGWNKFYDGDSNKVQNSVCNFAILAERNGLTLVNCSASSQSPCSVNVLVFWTNIFDVTQREINVVIWKKNVHLPKMSKMLEQLFHLHSYKLSSACECDVHRANLAPVINKMTCKKGTMNVRGWLEIWGYDIVFE